MKKLCMPLLALPAMLLTSCATIFSGTQATIILDGDVQEPITVTPPKGDSAEIVPPLDFTRFKLKPTAAKPFDRKRFYRHEVNVLFGLGSSVWRGTHDQQVGQFYDMDMEHPFRCGIDVDEVSWSIRYFYHLSPQLGIGAIFGKASAYDDLETPYNPEEPDAYASSPYAHVHTRSTFFMPAVKYSWYRYNGLSFYSTAALGMQRSHTWSSVHTISASIYPELFYEHHRQVVFNRKQWKPAPQLTALGFDFGGRHYRFFVELGYGVEGVFNMGMSYRFLRANRK